jgi:hypothetical protein
MTEPADLSSRLDETAAAFLALRPAALAGDPWPLAATFDDSDEAEWGPPEVLAHVSEMIPYWLGETERILVAAPADPAPFGRISTDAVRLAMIGRDRTVPARELLDRIASDIARLRRRLDGLTEADIARVGLHPRRGPMTVGEVLEGSVVAHLAEHAAQLGGLVGSTSADS